MRHLRGLRLFALRVNGAMRYSSRVFLYGPICLFVLLVVGVGVQWFRAADAWTRQVDALNGREIAPGITLHYGERQIGGFPFRVDTTFKDFRLSFAGPRAFKWHSEGFALHRLTYGNGKIVFEAGGKQTVSWLDSAAKLQSFAFLPGSVRGDAITDDGRLSRTDIVLVALASPTLRAAHLEFHLRHNPKLDALDLIMFGDDITVPGQSALKSARIEARITMAQFLKGLLSGNADWRTVLEAWRGGEGRVELVSVQTKGKTAATTKGRMTLDSEHALNGRFEQKAFGVTQFESAPLY